MASFKFVIGDPKTRKTYQIEIDQDKAVGIMGKKIGDKFNGDLIGLPGYEIKITGGTDKDGFPMHPRVHGMVRKKIVLSHPPGFHPKRKGMRKRKMVAGNTVSNNIAQINCKVIKEGSKKIPVLLGKEETKEEKKEEKPKKEEKKSEKKEKVKEERKDEKPKKEKKEEPKKEKKEKEEPKKDEKKQEKSKEPDYKKILSKSISDSKKEIKKLKDPNYKKLLEVEKKNKDRKGMKEYLEDKLE